MNNTVKAVFLSAFVFPGAAHWWLKKQLAAGLYAIAAALPLYYIIDVTMTQTQLIIDRVLLAGGQLDLLRINELVIQQMASLDTQGIELATAMLLCVWLVNIIDAIRLVRKREHE
ncbi:hypothetical protein [Moritella yayanosii]|uniref:Uncharacterized protein n=1 Tax=Moritella yayanosii TaxID=69539 RepID=A0A330LJW6_9GAMM|nr:hypothetical protein [Moritella yayanosii]SQD77354.1 conserved protein of unknown function [Moritella yayanosii]